MKLSAKWYYVNCGASLEGALFFAMLHQLLPLLFCAVGGVWSWYAAEARAQEEKTND